MIIFKNDQPTKENIYTTSIEITKKLRKGDILTELDALGIHLICIGHPDFILWINPRTEAITIESAATADRMTILTIDDADIQELLDFEQMFYEYSKLING